MRRLIAVAAIVGALWASGCASTRLVEGEDPPICHPDTGYCEVYDLASADEAALRANPQAVEVSCRDLANTGTIEAQRAQCVELIAAALVLLNSRFSGDLAPVSAEQVSYEKRSACADTFIPGREGLDCFDWIEARVPLRWLKPPSRR
ncbi:hypothetical protein [Lysobacter enzymogenes]|uniref:hypothetical protein n=1 Tax=Lysobacter enzymogenes TaxID=69 RepID=UPI001A968A7F|nr:hypothetical protein [Lysobacter enzymogenes]QQP96688.1 hypothetical protein JHW38_01115 [Lysobacter enzymogenes]